MLDFSKIFKDKQASVFDNMDKIARMITEAQGDEEGQEEEQPEEGQGEEGDMGGEEEMPVDPTQAPQEQPTEGEPADTGDGIYVSANEKATLAKAMLNALQADPPKPGEVPDNLLNVTSANADEVIKFIQSFTSLTSATSLADDGDGEGLVDTLKSV